MSSYIVLPLISGCYGHAINDDYVIHHFDIMINMIMDTIMSIVVMINFIFQATLVNNTSPKFQ